MPVFEIGLDDGTKLQIEADDEQAALAGVAHYQKQSQPQEPSGAMRAVGHAGTELVEGVKETAKRLAGVGPGRDRSKPDDYVPADVFKPSQWGQVLAENAPGLATDMAVGAGAAKVAPGGLKGKALAALIAAGLSGFTRTAGDSVAEATKNRTGDVNAPSSTADIVRGAGTSAAANAVGAALPTRLIPGLNTAVGTGAKGVANAAGRWLGTTALGGATGAASDIVDQVGQTIGTDKGVTVDPERALRAGATGAVTGGGAGGLRVPTDVIQASRLAKYGSAENIEASKNYATRLQNTEENVGSAKGDYSAHRKVVSDLRSELSDASKDVTGLSPEAENALNRLKSGEGASAKEVTRIEREAQGPSADNLSHLARTLFVASEVQKQGNYREGKWSGGLSGSMDSRVERMLNPLVVATGVGGTLAGAHFAGMMSPMFLGGAAGAYLGARTIDNIAGIRSPAETFMRNFADRQAILRKAQAAPPPAAPQAAPPGAQPGPWGPKPLATTSVPQAQSPAPAAPQPNLSPIAMSMLKQRLKAGLPEGLAPEPEANPLASVNPIALNMLKDKFKQQSADHKANVVQAISENKSRDADFKANVTQAESVNKNLNKDFRANQVQAESENRARDQEAADAIREEKQAAKDEAAAAREQRRAEEKSKSASERAQAKAERARIVAENAAARADKEKAKEAAKAEHAKAKEAEKAAKEAAKVEAAKIKALNAAIKNAKPTPNKVSKAQGEEVKSTRNPYEPLTEDLYPKGITPDEYAARELERYQKPGYTQAQVQKYKAFARASEMRRQATISELKERFPKYHHAFDGLLQQLQQIGQNKEMAADAVHHYADLLPDEAGAALRAAFK